MLTTTRWRAAMADARKRRGLNQTELATTISERSGRNLSQPEVSNIENGRLLSHWAIAEIAAELAIGEPQAGDRDELPALAYDDVVVDGAGAGAGDPAAFEAPHRRVTQVACSLDNDELVLLDDWALEQGILVGGRPNRSSALRALVCQLETGVAGASADDAPRGIHLVCRDDTGVTVLPDGTFETRAWRVSEDSARAAHYIALHERKTARSYRQGRLVSFRADDERPDRLVFVVEPEDRAYPWPGSASGQNPVALRR